MVCKFGEHCFRPSCTADLSSVDASEFFTAVVGPEKKEYNLITSFAVKSSKFFATAMKRTWKEGLEKKVELPDADTVDFDLYGHWLYTGDIFLKDLKASTYDQTHLDLRSEAILWDCLDDEMPSRFRKLATHLHYARKAYNRLMGLYVLADYLSDTALQNDIISAVFTTWSDTGHFLEMGVIVDEWWHELPNGCMMRKLIAKYWGSQDLEHTIFQSDCSPRVPVQVFAHAYDLYDDPIEEPDRDDPCEFHVHGEGIPSCEAST